MDISLIYKYLTGSLSAEELKTLLEWVNADKKNSTLFSMLKNTWAVSYQAGKMSAEEVQAEYTRFRTRLEQPEHSGQNDLFSDKPRLTFGKVLLRIAAVILFLYGGATTFMIFHPAEKTEYNEIRTRNGEKSQLVLADGTRIWINSASHLRYPTNVRSRKVRLELEGEAYFEVAKVKGRKFIVEASGLDITALGTAFNVKSYGESGMVETTLEEGKIKITGEPGKLKFSQPLLLIPNQRVTIYTAETPGRSNAGLSETTPPGDSDRPESVASKAVEKPEVVLLNEPNTDLYTSWKDGRLQFKKERFEDLAVRLERWYDVKITIHDREMKDWRYTGTFVNETIEQALAALSLSMHFSYNIDKNTISIDK